MGNVNELRFKRQGKGYIVAHYSASDGRAEVSTGRKIDKESWIAKKFDKGTNALKSMLDNAVTKHVESKDRAYEPILKAEVEAIMRTVIGKENKAASGTLVADFKRYCDDIRSGDIRPKGGGKQYSPSTFKHIDAISAIIDKYPVGKIKTARFQLKDWQSFVKAMLSENLSQNSMSTYNTYLISFFRRTRSLGWHKNVWYIDEDVNISPEETDGHVFYSPEELATLYKTETKTKCEEEVLDLFVHGCYIALRHSDLSNVAGSVYKDDTLHKNTKKKGVVVQIPLNSIARSIVEKYKGEIPVRDNTTFNTTIRRLAKRAGFTELSLHTRTVGGVTVETIKPKWELTGSHTMRRSFATNAYLAGVKVPAIMKVGGWKTEASFFRYLRISNAENAELLKKHAFFK